MSARRRIFEKIYKKTFRRYENLFIINRKNEKKVNFFIN